MNPSKLKRGCLFIKISFIIIYSFYYFKIILDDVSEDPHEDLMEM